MRMIDFKMTETIGTRGRILGDMLRASLLIVALSSTSMALLGDWKVWTPTLQPRMAVVDGDVAWIATSSGVVEWDLPAQSSRVHTRLDGLPTMEYASVVLDSQKTLWAIGVDGRIGYRTKGSSSWKSIGSYSTQNWTFSLRAAQYWKGYLVFGTDHGLSLFSTASKTAEDYAKAFGSLAGAVRAVMVTPGIPQGGKANPDTLWVGLDQGIAYATPQWDSIGKPGHFLADPSKWTVRTTFADNPEMDLVRDANGVRASSWWAEWSDETGRININVQAGQVKWDGNTVTLPTSAVHAAAAGAENLVVSSFAQGTYLIGPNGILQKADPEGTFPDFAPVNTRLDADGTPYVLSSNRVLHYDATTSNWSSDTIWFEKSENSVVQASWAFNETFGIRHRQGLAIGPKGEIIVPSWSDSAAKGGLYTRTGDRIWNHYFGTATDTCLTYAEENHPENGTALTGARSFPSGTWMSSLVHSPEGVSSPGRILFLKPGGKEKPQCFDLPRENTSSHLDIVNDFLLFGDTLWLGSEAGLIRVPAPKLTYPPTVATQATYIKPADQISPDLFRLAKTSFLGKDWIVGAAKGRLTLYPAHGGWGTPTRYDLITSDSSAPTLKQDYYALAVDAQGQIWAGGKDGIDIVQLVEPELDSLAPTFRHVQRITTADGLLDNAIYDFDLQVSTGKALIVSPHGVALWSSPFRPLATKLAKSSVRVYPNPVRLRDHRGGAADKVLIVDGATADSRFDLLASDGTLVMHLDESQQIGGRFQVELPAASKLRPGLYFWSLKDRKGSIRGPLLISE